MSQVYAMIQDEPQVGAAHTQTSATHTDPGNGPARFTKYDANHTGGGKVLRMLNEVLTDSKKLEKEAQFSEMDSQSAYENMMKESNDLVKLQLQRISTNTNSKAKAEEELIAKKEDLRFNMKELQELHDYKGGLHAECDFFIDNFDARQKARQDELDGLAEAKSILSGMK